MDSIRRIFRALWAVFLFVIVGSLELVITRPKTRPERAAWLNRFCRRMLRSFNLTYTVIGKPPITGAVISNHLSFFDILLHAAVRPTVFVSKAELRKTPLLGWMSMMAGTVYVVRGGGGSAQRAAEGMAKGFRDGLPVTFFPEGTTGTGEEIAMSFRSGLIAQTIEAEQPMVPAFISYQLSPRDLAAGRTAREDIHWGTQSLLSLIWAFMGLHDLHATIHFAADPIAFSPTAIRDRKLAAVEARKAVLVLGEAAKTTPQN